MKSFKKIRFLIIFSLLAVTAGLFFALCGFTFALPKGVSVNGVEVGGLSRAAALKVLRNAEISEINSNPLKIIGKTQEYIFTYPEVNFHDDFPEVLSAIRKNGEYFATVTKYLNGFDEIVNYIAASESKKAVTPFAEFHKSGAPFSYYEGEEGYSADRKKLAHDIRENLSGKQGEIVICYTPLKFSKSLESVKSDTRLLSSYTTYFDPSNLSRAHNIKLAAELINGSILQKDGIFSFNGTVGPRTSARGFKSAKIIEKGEFVEGIGGGVCQVSTTLFNAALLSGCTPTEYHAHSLAVSYVPPSFDAMVSGYYYDLKFKNTTKNTIYIRAFTGENYITFCFYGEFGENEYSFSSKIVGSIPAPEEFTLDESKVQSGRDGIISEGYLTVKCGDGQTTTLLRRDSYLPIKKVTFKCEEGEAPPEIGE